MRYFAINTSAEQAVYLCNNPYDERYLKEKFEGQDFRFFKISEKQEALDFAGVKKITRRLNDVAEVPETSPVGYSWALTNKLLKIYKALKDKGYPYATICMDSGDCFGICLNSFKLTTIDENNLPVVSEFKRPEITVIDTDFVCVGELYDDGSFMDSTGEVFGALKEGAVLYDYCINVNAISCIKPHKIQ